MLKKIILFCFLLMGLLIGLTLFQPKNYYIYREVSMNASPEIIFPYLVETKNLSSTVKTNNKACFHQFFV